MSKRYKIGVLIQELDGHYHSRIWKGLRDAALSLNVDLIYFVGKAVDSPFFSDYMANSVYQLASKTAVDGLIAVSTSLFAFVKRKRYHSFFSNYTDLPIVSIGETFSDIPHITIRADIGITDAITHLIRVHKRKKFLLIRGPVDNEESNLRTKVFLQTLKNEGISFNPQYLFNGLFIEESGKQAIEFFFENSLTDFDAIFAQNDESAIGAMQELIKRGIKIPDDVSLCGFDDVAHLESLNPPLSTVHQPLLNQTKHALTMICELLDGKQVKSIVLDTAFHARESCGCENLMTKVLTKKSKMSPSQWTLSLKSILAILSGSEYTQVLAREEISRKWDSIKKILSSEFTKRDSLLIDFLNKYLFDSVTTSQIKTWLLIIRTIEDICIETDTKHFPDQDSIFNKIYLLINKALIWSEGNNYWATSDIFWRSRVNVAEHLVNSYDAKTLSDSLLPLNLLGIPQAYVVLYDDVDKYDLTTHGRCICSICNNQLDIIEDKKFTIATLLPDEIITKSSAVNFIIKPIYFKNERFGYLITEEGPCLGFVYENLRLEVASAIRGINLISKRADAERKLHQTIIDLQNTNNELKDTQGMLIAAEKMAALGSLVSGVAHEMNTPLGNAITGVTYMLDKVNELGQKPTLSKDFFSTSIQRLQDSGKLVFENLEKARLLVNRFKATAINEPVTKCRSFNIREFLENFFTDSLTCREGTVIEVILNCEKNITVKSLPTDYHQIFSELIENSIRYGFAEKKSKIIISVEEECDYLTIFYEDNGVGIAADIKENIFNPFVTLGRGEGAKGLGLYVVYNLLTHRHSGSLELMPSAQGAKFKFRLKKNLDF